MGDEEILSQSIEGAPVKFIFKKTDDYKMHFINGAYGGLTPHGDVVCNFFFEYRELPESEDAVVSGGKVDPVPNKQLNMIRELKAGIILTPAQAMTIGKWLQDKAGEFEKIFSVGAV